MTERPIEELVAEANATGETKREPAIPMAEEASNKSEASFRKHLTKVVLDAIAQGVNKAEVNVIAVKKEIVERFIEDMKASGYSIGVTANRRSKGDPNPERQEILHIGW